MSSFFSTGTDLFIHTLMFQAGGILAWLLIWLLPFLLLTGVAWYCLSLPLRRQERARFFLDLIETGFDAGDTVEHTIIFSSRSGDVSLGARHHLLAAYLEAGYPLGRALDRVPSLLPPPVRAMLQAGEHIGDLRRVLPACRRLVVEGSGFIQSAANYQIAFLLVGNPAMVVGTPFLLIKVFPVFGEILSGLGKPFPGGVQFFHHASAIAYVGQLASVALIVFAGILFLGGPGLVRWMQAGWYPVLDWVFYALPWRRRRMQRDFSTLLAVLLDAEVPEDKAVRLAAECTNNRVFIERANRVLPRLEQGESLLVAVNEIDPTGDFRWRLANAIHAQRGFAASLAGWHDALEARAFQQEQAVSQFVTTALVMLNGLYVGWVAWAFFKSIVAFEAGPLLQH